MNKYTHFYTSLTEDGFRLKKFKPKDSLLQSKLLKENSVPAANPKNKVDELSDHVEKKVRKLAIVAARKAVRSLWNESFSKAIEKEIRHLCSQSIENMDISKLSETNALNPLVTPSPRTPKSDKPFPQSSGIKDGEEAPPSNNLNQLDEEKTKDEPSDPHLESPDQHEVHAPKKTKAVAPIEPQNEPSTSDEKNIHSEITVEEPSIASRSTEQANTKLLAQVKKNSNSSAVAQIDLLFLQILDTFVVKIASLARSSTEYILEVSNTFLDEKAKNALVDFHNLYFGDSKIGETSKQVNAEIDDMLENLQSILDEGKELTLNSIEESEEGKMNRLSLSGLQKRLEMIISMDVGIKERLIPILHSMQFEDFLNQRLLHIRKIWAHVISLETGHAKVDLEKLKETLAKYPSSMDEREDFYHIVLKKDPPEGLKDRQSLVDILF